MKRASFVSALCVVLTITLTSAFAQQDDWNGGTGNWSNAADWSAGEPVGTSDVKIYSGGSDNVTLDVGSTTINSLTLGGAPDGYTSELTDGGTKQTLTILQQLTIGQTGELIFGGSGSSITAGTLNNSGTVSVGTGATLNLTNQPGGITDVVAGSSIGVLGAFTAGANSALYQLNSVEGTLGLYGQNFSITPGSGTLTNTGAFYLDYNPGNATASNLTINGNVNNSGQFYTGYFYGGANTLNITGSLTNSGTFDVYYSGVANMGAVNNSGTFAVLGGGATANIAGDVTNSNSMYTQGGAINITGGLTNSGSFYLYDSGDSASMQTLSNTGSVSVGTGATLNLTNQPGGITDVVAGSSIGVLGSLHGGRQQCLVSTEQRGRHGAAVRPELQHDARQRHADQHGDFLS